MKMIQGEVIIMHKYPSILKAFYCSSMCYLTISKKKNPNLSSIYYQFMHILSTYLPLPVDFRLANHNNHF